MVAFSNQSTLDCVFRSLRFREPFPSFPCKQKVETERFGCVFKWKRNRVTGALIMQKTV